MNQRKDTAKDDVLDKLQTNIKLYDFYGALLTERQSTCFTMYYFEDLSMTEIGTALGITPQAVADQIKRTVKKLNLYEEKLKLAQKELVGN